MRDVTADFQTLMNQAPWTVEKYYSDLEDFFDSKYGKGWSKAHSETVAQMVNASSRDFATSCILGGMQDLTEQIKGLANAVMMIDSNVE